VTVFLVMTLLVMTDLVICQEGHLGDCDQTDHGRWSGHDH
jgi:hypothetical protein